jgi:hypothetical protein
MLSPAVAVEAINKSEKHHQLKYTEVITDGDSSINAALLQKGNYSLTNFKCCIHAMRSFKSRLFGMRKNAKLAIRNAMAPVHASVTTGVYAAIKHNRASGDISGLAHDILNSIDHVLDNHEKCQPYFCNQDKVKNVSETYKLLQQEISYVKLRNHLY